MTDGPPEPGPDWCYSCNRSEPIPDGAYLVCRECFHCWVTKDDFTADVRIMLHEINLNETGITVRVEDFPFCPLCSHNF